MTIPNVVPREPIKASLQNKLVGGTNAINEMSGINGIVREGNTLGLVRPLGFQSLGFPYEAYNSGDDELKIGEVCVIDSQRSDSDDIVGQGASGLFFDVQKFDSDNTTSLTFGIVAEAMGGEPDEGASEGAFQKPRAGKVFLDGIIWAVGKREDDTTRNIIYRGANPIDGELELEIVEGIGVFEVLGEQYLENEFPNDFSIDHWVLIRLQNTMPWLYQATADATSNIIPGKRVKSDGTLIGNNQDFWAMD